jgi:hypothetical protein
MDNIKQATANAMKTLLTGWHIMRIIRLVLGLAVLTQGVVIKDFTIIIPGLLLAVLVLAMANTGCGSSNGCSIHPASVRKTNRKEDEELDTGK